jgi:hypothetical protein
MVCTVLPSPYLSMIRGLPYRMDAFAELAGCRKISSKQQTGCMVDLVVLEV